MTADTVARVRREFDEVEVPALGHDEGASARNRGVRHASTPYVAFSDDDSWWATGALPCAEELFARHPGLGLIAARTIVEPAGRPDPVCEEMARSALGRDDDLPGPSVPGFVTDLSGPARPAPRPPRRRGRPGTPHRARS